MRRELFWWQRSAGILEYRRDETVRQAIAVRALLAGSARPQIALQGKQRFPSATKLVHPPRLGKPSAALREDYLASPCHPPNPVQAGTETCQIPVPTLPRPLVCNGLNPDRTQNGPRAELHSCVEPPTAATLHAL